MVVSNIQAAYGKEWWNQRYTAALQFKVTWGPWALMPLAGAKAIQKDEEADLSQQKGQ